MVNAYVVLGVDPSSSQEEIRKAFKRIASQNHPDKFKNNPSKMRRYKEASAAYAILSDHRDAHDRALRSEESMVTDAAVEISEMLRDVAARKSGKLGTVLGGFASAIGIVAEKRDPTPDELKEIFDGMGTVSQWFSDRMTPGGRGDGT